MDWILPAGAEADLTWYVPVALLAAFCTGFGKAGFAGLGFLSVPLMMMVVDKAPVVLGMWLPVLIVCDVLAISHFPNERRWDIVGRLLPGSVVGILIGVFVIAAIPSPLLKLGIGISAVTFVALQLCRSWFASRAERRSDGWRPGWPASSVVGLAAGFCTAVAHAAGVIINMFLLPQRLSPQDFVGTAARYFFIVNTAKVPFFVHGELITPATLKATLWLLPIAPAAAWLGARVNRRLTSETFNRVMYVLVIVAGVKLIVDQLVP